MAALLSLLKKKAALIRVDSVETEDVRSVPSRTVIIATGAAYRRRSLENLSQFEGVGVYYGATPMEAQLCVGDEVVVVGGGNSAGQAATFLAKTARRVHVIVRSTSLAESMSRYLIRRLEVNPSIDLPAQTEIVALEGNGHLERVRWRDDKTGSVEAHDIKHVFMMAGALPNTGWLDNCLALEAKGFIETGADLSPDDLAKAQWPLKRSPHLLETCLPGVFAVGEGSIAVALVHQVLQE